MTTETWLLLSLTLFAGAASPGPSLALVVRTALADGRLAGLTVAFAHGLGVGLYALLIVIGVAEAIRRTSWVMDTLQFGGVLFLAYLGVLMIRGGIAAIRREGEQALTESHDYGSRQSNLARNLREGFLIVFLNPKVLVFFLAIFSQFLTPTQSVGSQVTAAGLAAAIDFLWYALIATLVSVSAVHRTLARFSGYLDVGFGLCLGGVAIWIAVSLI